MCRIHPLELLQAPPQTRMQLRQAAARQPQLGLALPRLAVGFHPLVPLVAASSADPTALATALSAEHVAEFQVAPWVERLEYRLEDRLEDRLEESLVGHFCSRCQVVAVAMVNLEMAFGVPWSQKIPSVAKHPVSFLPSRLLVSLVAAKHALAMVPPLLLELRPPAALVQLAVQATTATLATQQPMPWEHP